MIGNIKRLWLEEPVIVRGVLGLAVAAGVLTATEASSVGDAIAAVVNAVALLSARSKVRPEAKDTPPT